MTAVESSTVGETPLGTWRLSAASAIVPKREAVPLAALLAFAAQLGSVAQGHFQGLERERAGILARRHPHQSLARLRPN